VARTYAVDPTTIGRLREKGAMRRRSCGARPHGGALDVEQLTDRTTATLPTRSE
jgi:hypothetical protein